MEFSYNITEPDYLNAWRISRRAPGSRVFRTVMFWIFLLVCLMLFWGIVGRNAGTPVEPSQAPASVSQGLLVNVLPFVLIGAIWVFILFRLGPRSLRRMYRKDPAMQGTYSVKITPDSIAMTNTAGISMQAGWNNYASWKEARNLIVLVLQSGAFFPIVITGLSEGQRSELRGILAAAIPSGTQSPK